MEEKSWHKSYASGVPTSIDYDGKADESQLFFKTAAPQPQILSQRLVHRMGEGQGYLLALVC